MFATIKNRNESTSFKSLMNARSGPGNSELSSQSAGRKHTCLAWSLCGLLAASPALAQQCETEKAAMDQAGKRVSEEIKADVDALTTDMKKETDEISGRKYGRPNDVEMVVQVQFDVDWKTEEIILDLPQVTMRTQEWKFDVPQVAMKAQEWIYHLPSTKMVLKKTGEYPEVKCSKHLIPKCTVKWSPIMTKVPEFFMQEHKTVLDIPEFWIDTTSMKLDIPEFTWDETSMKFDIPHFKLKSVQAGAEQFRDDVQRNVDSVKEKYQPKIQKIQMEARDRMKEGTANAMNQYFSCIQKQASIQMTDAAEKIAETTEVLKEKAEEFQQKNIPNAVELVSKQATDLNASSARTLEQIKVSVAEISALQVDRVDEVLDH